MESWLLVRPHGVELNIGFLLETRRVQTLQDDNLESVSVTMTNVESYKSKKSKS